MTLSRATSRTIRRTCAPAVLFTLCAVLGACGVRTEPRPPEDTAAQAPDDFRAKLTEQGVELRWDRVSKSADGGRLYDLAAFVVERRSDDARFEKIATISVTDTDRIRTQKTFHFVDESPPQGDLEYRVRAVTKDGEAGVPTEVLRVTVPAAQNHG